MSQEDRDKYLAAHIKDLFFFDGTEDITWETFEAKLGNPDMQQYFRAINVDPGEAEGLFALLDADGTGAIDPGELVDGLLRLRGGAKCLDLALLMHQTCTLEDEVRDQREVVQGRLAAIEEYLSKS